MGLPIFSIVYAHHSHGPEIGESGKELWVTDYAIRFFLLNEMTAVQLIFPPPALLIKNGLEF